MTSILFVLLVFSGEPDKILHTKCIYPTVMVISETANLIGSGVIVRSDKNGDHYFNVVVSCAHIVKSDMKYKINVGRYENWSVLKGYEEYDTHIYMIDKTLDLSVFFFISKVAMPVADVNFDAQLFIGNEVYRVGYGLKQQARIDYGVITSVNIELDDFRKNILRTSIDSIAGDSGGPIFEDNKVVGLLFAVQPYKIRPAIPAFHISYGLPISYFKITKPTNNNSIDFVINKEAKLPYLPFFTLQVQEMVDKELLEESE